jgi:hypothetical protein
MTTQSKPGSKPGQRTRDDEGELYRDRMVPKYMARITYFVPPHTQAKLVEQADLLDLLTEIHAIRVRYSGYSTGLLTVTDWSRDLRRFTAYFNENRDFEIGVTQKALSTTKYHFGIYITDLNSTNDEEFQEFKTMFVDFRLRTLEEVPHDADYS